MGYFSNGSEGMDYQDRYCSRCVHCDGCPVWGAHLAFSYKECNNPDSILHMLIPRRKDGLGNERCRMFRPVAETDRIEPKPPLKGVVCSMPSSADSTPSAPVR